MNNTITLSQLITRLAKATGVDNNTSRRFLRTFFATVEENLEQGQSVNIKGIGTFRRTDTILDSGRSSVAFVPDANFLEDINRPFEMFEAVELADGVDFSEMEDQTLPVEEEMHDVENKIQSAPSEEPESTSESETEQVSVTVPNVENTDVAEERSEISEKTDPIQHRPIIVEHDPIVIQPHTAVPSSDGDDYESDEIPDDYPGGGEKHRPSRVWIWSALFVGIACILGYFAAVWAVPMPEMDYEEDENKAVDTVATEAVSTVEEISVEDLGADVQQETPVAIQPEPKQESPVVTVAPEPVYDTVSISLIKLAKKHYGIGDYWVFIFDANRDKIKNPNAIRPGTKVRIPDKSELPGGDASETREIARKKSAEYLAVY